MVAFCAPWGNIPRDQADSAGMLAHLHAYFVDADLLYDDEYARLSMSPLFAFVTGEGVVSNHWPAGATWLQLPGWALGVTAARVLEALGIGSASPLGVVAVLGLRAWACLVLVGIARSVAHGAARASESAATGAFVAAAFVLGTPILYYAIEAPLRPHLWGAACVLGLVRVWSRPALGSPRARALGLSLLAGLAITVRPQLAPLALLVAHDVWSTRARGDVPARLGLAALGLLLWPLVHLRTELWMYGTELSQVAAGGVTHHLYAFLCSPYHGALTWCPVLVVAFVAVGRAAWLRERGGVLIAVLLAHQLWLDAGMRAIEPMTVLGTRTWAGGTGFAARKLVDVLPLMLPAIESLVAAGARRRWGRPLLLATLLLCVPTVLLHAAAVIAPEATTGAVLDWGALGQVLRLPFAPEAIAAGLRPRALPLAVPLVVSLVVTVPLLLVVLRVAAATATCSVDVRLRLLQLALLLSALLAHGWLSVLQIRSDAALLDDPARMQRAAARMHPAHAATVAQIEAHHEQLRRRLGTDAAP